MIKGFMFTKKAWEHQEEVHELCREGLQAGKMAPEGAKLSDLLLRLDAGELAAVEDIRRRLPQHHYIASMERYNVGFNVWVGKEGLPYEAVGLFTYRREQ